MGAIDIGAEAINRLSTFGYGYTIIDLNNPANEAGVIDHIYVYPYSTLPIGTKIGTFYGTAPNFTCRDFITTTSVLTAGGVREITGISIDVQIGDLIGIYFAASGAIERSTLGYSGIYYKAGDQFETGLQGYALFAGDAISVKGTGTTSGEVPTLSIGEPVLYLDQDSFTAEGNILDVGLDYCTYKGFCYMAGAGTPTTANSVVYYTDEAHPDGYDEWAVGEYLVPISGLNPGTLYSVRAFAINAVGTGYSSVIQVTTLVVVAPTAVPLAATDITSISATMNGQITDDGGEVCEAMFRWCVGSGFPYTFSFNFCGEVWTETDWQNSLVTDSLFDEALAALTPDTDYVYETRARSDTDAEEQTVGDGLIYLEAAAPRLRAGQYLPSPSPERMITELSFWLAKSGSPTGDVTFTIRNHWSDIILNNKIWGDASAITGTLGDPVKCTVIFDTPVLITSETKILVEYSGGDGSNFVAVGIQTTDVKADEYALYWDDSYHTYATYDCTYSYAYHLTGEWSASEYFTTLVALASVYLTGGLTFAGDVVKTTTRYLTGELALAGVVAKTISKYLTGGLSFIGTLIASAAGQFSVSVGGSLTFGGSLSKTTTKYLTGVFTPVGALVKTTTKYLTAALAFLGGLSRPGEPHTMDLFVIPYRDMRAFTQSYRDMAVESRPYRDMITENREVKL